MTFSSRCGWQGIFFWLGWEDGPIQNKHLEPFRILTCYYWNPVHREKDLQIFSLPPPDSNRTRRPSGKKFLQVREKTTITKVGCSPLALKCGHDLPRKTSTENFSARENFDFFLGHACGVNMWLTISSRS